MEKRNAVRAEIKVRKTVRLGIDGDVVRLAKSKAASQEVALSFVVDRLLRKWVAGNISILNGVKNE